MTSDSGTLADPAAVPNVLATGIGVEDYLTGDFPQHTWLVEGDVVVNDPSFRHQIVAARLLAALSAWVAAGPDRGVVAFGGNWVLGPSSVLKPDVWWADAPLAAKLAGSRHTGPPTLAVEVRSPGTWRYDLGAKRRLYRQFRVPELWLVDHLGDTVFVDRSDGTELELIEGELTSPLLPGFALTLGELFAR